MNEKYDEKLKSHLKEKTEDIINLKDEIWSKIDVEVTNNQVDKVQRKGKINKVVTLISFATIIMLLIGTVFTDTGQALIKSVQEMFVKEKNIEFNIEGETEDVEVELGLNNELSYVIYIDKSRYKLISGEQSDKIVPKEEFADIPEVSLEISKVENKTRAEVIANIQEEITQLEMEFKIEETIVMPFEGVLISAIGKGASNLDGENGVDWDSPVYRCYVMEENSGELFVIKERYFLEAAEGHGARFAAMLETFVVIEQ